MKTKGGSAGKGGAKASGSKARNTSAPKATAAPKTKTTAIKKAVEKPSPRAGLTAKNKPTPVAAQKRASYAPSTRTTPSRPASTATGLTRAATRPSVPTASVPTPTVPTPTPAYSGPNYSNAVPSTGISGLNYTPSVPFGGTLPSFSNPTSTSRSRRRAY